MNNNTHSQNYKTVQDNLNLAAHDNNLWREQIILTILRVACVLITAYILVSSRTSTRAEFVLYISLFIILLVVTLLKIPYSIRAVSLLIMVFSFGTNSILVSGPWLDGSIYFIAFIILSALLFDQRVDVFAFLLSVSAFTLVATLQQLGFYHLKTQNLPATTFTDWAVYIFNFSIVGAVLIYAIGQFKGTLLRIVQEINFSANSLTSEFAQLENRIRERTEELELITVQLRSSGSFTKTIAEIQNISELIDTATNLMSDQFGYYHVGLYLLDDRKKIAFLQASSSRIGKALVGQGIRIERDRRNIFNQVIEQKRSYLTLDADEYFIADNNFPLTRSRLMTPLIIRGSVIGVLDFHSDQQQSFNTQDAEVLQILTDLVAVSIDNLRHFNETKNLAYDLENTTSIQTREKWTKFTSRNKPAYQFTPTGVRPLFSNTNHENDGGLQIPLTLHGQNIGGILLKRKGIDAAWSDRERLFVENIANQAALALENSRLVEEAQKNAIRNQVIANISVRIRESLDIESVIRTATTELRRVFDLKEAEISIGGSQTEIMPIKRHTSSLRIK